MYLNTVTDISVVVRIHFILPIPLHPYIPLPVVETGNGMRVGLLTVLPVLPVILVLALLALLAGVAGVGEGRRREFEGETRRPSFKEMGCWGRGEGVKGVKGEGGGREERGERGAREESGGVC